MESQHVSDVIYRMVETTGFEESGSGLFIPSHTPYGKACVPRCSELYIFYCPGCGSIHFFRTRGEEPCWKWNGSMVTPTVIPSIVIKEHDSKGYGKQVCHLLIKEGFLEFLEDCDHPLKGQCVQMTVVQ